MTNKGKNANKGHNDGLLKTEEVAFLLHVHANTVRRWSNFGVLKSYCVNSRGDRRYKREDVNRFLTLMD